VSDVTHEVTTDAAGTMTFSPALDQQLQELAAEPVVRRVVITCWSYGQALDIKVIPSHQLPPRIAPYVPVGTTHVTVDAK
jgi:hypothetical protein